MTPGEKERYSRQILFAPIGEANLAGFPAVFP
jgi:molybdopterin/thiamine biosynthesis adenylyltransferase